MINLIDEYVSLFINIIVDILHTSLLALIITLLLSKRDLDSFAIAHEYTNKTINHCQILWFKTCFLTYSRDLKSFIRKSHLFHHSVSPP